MLIFKVWLCLLVGFHKADYLFAFQTCQVQGNFQDSQDLTCKHFYTCFEEPNGSFTKEFNTCPDGLFYNPDENKCIKNYSCPFNKHWPSVKKTQFVCYQTGKYDDPNDPYCDNYFLCTQMPNGTFLATLYSCPEEQKFNPTNGFCSDKFLCGGTKSTSTTSPISYMCYSNKENIISSVCSENGRFLNPWDITCTTYFLCSVLHNGSFVQTEYTCPSGSWFDPENRLCSNFYHCPCVTFYTTNTIVSSSTNNITTTTPYKAASLTTVLYENSSIYTSFAISVSTNLICSSDKTFIKDFICSEKGRFFNPKDTTCTTYFLCTLLQNGSFIQTKYTCPFGSWFDTKLQLCSIFYECPCSVNSSTDFDFTTQLPTRSIDEDQTKKSSYTQIMSTGTTPTISASTICFANRNATTEFICSQKGRYFNQKDVTCTTYFLCSLLQNGSFIQTQYTCPSESWFDPELRICSTIYQCPCLIFTTKSSITFSGISTDKSSLFSKTSAISTISTSSSCFDSKNNITNFICSEKGRFNNPRDVTCSTYFLCSLLRNGSFIQTEYNCPYGSKFDPELQLCTIYYKCSCSAATSTDLSPSSEMDWNNSDTTLTTDGSTVLLISTPEASTPCWTNNSDAENFVCSQKGRYRNLKDLTCSTYFLCSLLRNGSFIQTKYYCPNGSYFDPELQLCSVVYHCPCIFVTNVATSSVTTVSTEIPSTENSTSTTIFSICAAYESNKTQFACAEKGRFYNAADTTCTTYFLCSLLRNGSFIQTEYLCPLGSFFDPELHLCSVYYQCPCQIEESSTVLSTTKLSSDSITILQSTTHEATETDMSLITTTNPCVVSEVGDFSCSQKGRFPNLLDTSCTSYYLCNLLKNGSFIQTKYFCPSGSHFDPWVQLCNIYYECPCHLSD